MSSLKGMTRRQLLQWTAAVSGTTLLAACVAPAPANQQSQGEPATVDRKVIRWWDNYSDEHPIGQTLIKKVFPNFVEENPGWEIEFTFVTNTELVPKFITSRMAGEPPDLWANFAGRGSLTHAGYCLPLQDFVHELGHWDDMVEGFRTVASVGPDLIGYPSLCGTKMYVYRKDYFEEAGLDPDTFPDNWDDLQNALIALTQYNDDGTIKRSGLKMGRNADWEQITVMAYQNGGAEFDQADPVTGVATVNLPEFAEAFTWMLDLKRVHKIDELEGMTLPPGTASTAEGFSAMEVQGPWTIPNMRVRTPETMEFIGVGAPLARNSGGERVGLANANHIISVYKESEIVEAALSLLEVYARDENQITLCNAIDDAGEFPQFFLTGRKSLNENLPWVQEEPLVRDTAFIEYAGSGRDVGYDHVGYREMSINIWGPLTEMALFGLREDQKALDEMASKADAVTNRILSSGA